MIEIDGATLWKLSSTKDGGWRLVIDAPGGPVGDVSVIALNTMREKSLKLTIDETPQP